MKTVYGTVAALALFAGAAHAGGIARSGNSYATLFESGDYVEFSFRSTKPKVTGDYQPALGGGSTGNMAESYFSMGFAYKNQINDKLALGFYLNEPYGANSLYTNGAYTGLSANWGSRQASAVLKYQINPAVSVYGGLRFVESTAEIAIPGALIQPGVTANANTQKTTVDGQIAALNALPALDATQQATLAALTQASAQLGAVLGAPTAAFNYTASGEKDTQVAWLLGVAYEKPEIALRVSLTYEAGYTHKFNTTESLAALGIAPGTAGVTEVEMPQSIVLDAQSGIAENTLLFGSIRWTEWSKWEVRPPAYNAAIGDRVTGLDNDTTTYQLGIGRRFNDQFSGFARLTYEKANGGVASRLNPTDGVFSLGIGGSYTKDNMKITGGIEFAKLGDATDGSATAFNDNTATGIGVSIGYSF